MSGLVEAKKSTIELFPGNSLGQLSEGILSAVSKTFEDQGNNSPTRADVKYRFDICMNWAGTLRGDLGWGLSRIIGQLPYILKSELEGTRWEPSNRMCWIPSDGR